MWGVKEWDYVWECEGVECGSVSGMSGSGGMVGSGSGGMVGSGSVGV